MARPLSALRDFLTGARLPLDGARLVVSDGRLMLLAALPVALTTLVTFAAGLVALLRGKALLESVWRIGGACSGCGALAWLWSRLEVVAFEAAFIVLVLLCAAAAGLVAAWVLAAPAMDALSRRAMRGAPKGSPEVVPLGERPLWVQGLRSVARAARHALVYLAGAALFALLALVPGGAAVATPLEVVWTAAWMFANSLVYPLQWQGEARFANVLQVARSRPALSLGFATGQAVLLFIPFAALAVTPMAIAGACLLVQRAGPAPASGKPAPVAPAARPGLT